MRISIKQLKKIIREGIGSRGYYWEDDEPVDGVDPRAFNFDDDGNPIPIHGQGSSKSYEAKYKSAELRLSQLEKELEACKNDGSDPNLCQMLQNQIDQTNQLLDYLWDQFN